MIFEKAFKTVVKQLHDNSPTLLTAVGVAGTVSTAVLSVQAGFKASEILSMEQQEQDRLATLNNKDPEPMSPQDKLRVTWEVFVPPLITGSLTITAIIGSTVISQRRAAALAAAYSLSEKAIKEYKEKVVEKIGENKERQIRQEIAEDRVRNHPPSEGIVNRIPENQVLCYDSYTARYFYSDMETLRKAENAINHTIVHSYYASLTDFYSHIGLDRTKVSDDLGWNADRLLELRFSTTMSDNDRPCIVVDFDLEPIHGYSRIV